MPSVADKRRIFRALHQSGCFVIPNPWDVGTARYLQHLGFKALATTSSGAAFAKGLPDAGMSRDATLLHIRAIVEASDLPVNADFRNGFAADADAVAKNVRLCVAAGVAGLSIEDQIPGTEDLYDVGLATERVAAARAAIDAAGGDTMLVARSECYLTGHREPLTEAIRRLRAFAAAGADCLYAPGVRARNDIAAIIEAIAPKPVNVLIGWASDLTVGELADLGVRRISLGGALAKTAWAAFIEAAQDIATTGGFGALSRAKGAGDLDAFFRTDAAARER